MNPKYITTTVGLNIGQIDIHGIRLSFWDLGGQQDLQSLWDKYYQESHAIIYVIDSNDRERMDECKVVFGQYAEQDRYLWHVFNNFLSLPIQTKWFVTIISLAFHCWYWQINRICQTVWVFEILNRFSSNRAYILVDGIVWWYLSQL